MFDCKTSDWRVSSRHELLNTLAQDGGLSFGLYFETSTLVTIFGVEIYQLYDLLVHDLSKNARERIQKLMLLQNTSSRCIRIQRLEITRFLRLVLGNATRLQGTTLCDGISIILNCLPKLIEPLLMYGWNSVFDGEYCGYEIYHGVLEWRWLILLLAKEMKEFPIISNTDFGKCFRKRNSLITYEKLYRTLLIDMLELAFHQFRINAIEDVIFEAPYQCNCVKLMWLGMMVLSETNKEMINFWTTLNECFSSLLKERKDGYIFKIWLINALAHFSEQKKELEGIEQPIAKLPHHYTLIDDIVKEFLKSCNTEQHVRVFLILLKPIITELWPVRFETVIHLWDYFSVRLNSSFHTNSDSLDAVCCVSRSIDDFIAQAAVLASPESTKNSLNLKMNSFNMFLILLTSMIRHCTAKALKTKVQIIFNRIFLKLGPKKYENMTEQSIYNLGLMLLTMISSTNFEEDYCRVSKQMQLIRLTGGPINLPIDIIIKRITIATQAHMALLVLFSNTCYDKTSHSVTFLESFENVLQKYGNRLQTALELIAEGTILIYNRAISKGSLARGEKSLIGPWMLKYIRHSTSDRWHKLLDAISKCLKSSISMDEDFLTAINQHVIPFVNEQFSKKISTPPCIAQIAACITLRSISNNAQNGQVLSYFSTYANCPTAHSDQQLTYLKLIIESHKMLTLVDEKTILRLWLKMGFFYDREILLDLTRVVYGLDEFKALCEIPQYEMFESNAIPIELFFRFVGKRYREVDNIIKMDLKMKLHTIFQQFDKWIPNPSRIIRQRILAVLVLALKECTHAFYIKSNSTCLYHLAFKHFFLPFSVLTDRYVQLDYIEDVARVWHKVMEILGKMEYSSDPMVGDNVFNMLIKWVPQFAKLSNSEHALRPVMLFFCSRNEELVLYAMPRFVLTYVDLQRCLPKSNALQAMQILQTLIESLLKRKDYGKIILFIRTVGLSVMQHAFMCNETFSTRIIAMELLNNLMISTEGSSNMVKQEMRNVFALFTRKYLSLSAESYFTFVCRLADRNKKFIRLIIDEIRSEVAQAEKNRGQETDLFLRNALHRLETVSEPNKI
ncbi:protein MMS22-like [Anopheles merus]|uniref:protein MMS22-like n=1 Tax=Anopheles merus TaxID=30066 RepID=UPI001BE4D1BA|nr:protein MMS22-like [Anopheles merus]XP_041787812.1 protein MMS22-like [Anopheles merus]